MTKEQPTLPSPEEALKFLIQIKGIVTYPDIDATTDEGARKLLARWECFEMAILSLNNLTQAATAVWHQLVAGEASEGSERDIDWCAKTLDDAINTH